MRVVIVGAAPVAGREAFYRALLSDADAVVAADAAGDWCERIGRTPDVVVGDFDSAPPGSADRLVSEGVRVVRHPAVKDATDLELCAVEARRLGASRLTFAAAFTARLDHTLAAVGTVLECSDLNAEIREPGMTAWALDTSSRSALHVAMPQGTVFSVLSTGGATGVGIGGAAYPLVDARLGSLESLGVSNVAEDTPVHVSLGTGRALVIALAENLHAADS